MSGELFHIWLKMKINSFSALCGELGTNLHLLLSLIHLHIMYAHFLCFSAHEQLDFVFCLLYLMQCNEVENKMSTFAYSVTFHILQ